MNKTDSDAKNQQKNKCGKCGLTCGLDRNGKKHKCDCIEDVDSAENAEYVLCEHCQISTDLSKARTRGGLCPECYIEYLDDKLDGLE
jgi:hypothetical protein